MTASYLGCLSLALSACLPVSNISPLPMLPTSTYTRSYRRSAYHGPGSTASEDVAGLYRVPRRHVPFSAF